MKVVTRVVPLAFIVVFILSHPAQGAEILLKNLFFKNEGGEYNVLDFPHIIIQGPIAQSDIQPLKDAVSYLRDNGYIRTPDGKLQPIITFNSPGGDVDAALKMGRMLRNNLAMTVVAPGQQCNSSCTLMFVAGVSRIVIQLRSQDLLIEVKL